MHYVTSLSENVIFESLSRFNVALRIHFMHSNIVNRLVLTDVQASEKFGIEQPSLENTACVIECCFENGNTGWYEVRRDGTFYVQVYNQELETPWPHEAEEFLMKHL